MKLQFTQLAFDECIFY